jgi:hypothetical protein
MLSEGFIGRVLPAIRGPARAALGCVRQSATQLVGHLYVKLTDITKSRVLGERRGFGVEFRPSIEATG